MHSVEELSQALRVQAAAVVKREKMVEQGQATPAVAEPLVQKMKEEYQDRERYLHQWSWESVFQSL